MPGVGDGDRSGRPWLGALPLGLAGAGLLALGASVDASWWSTGCLGAGGALVLESAYLARRGHLLGRRPRPPGA